MKILTQRRWLVCLPLLLIGAKPRLPQAAEAELSWSAEGDWLVAEAGGTAVRLDPKGRGTTVPIRPIHNVTLSPSGGRVVGVSDGRFVSWDAVSANGPSLAVPPTDRTPEGQLQGRFGDLQITRTGDRAILSRFRDGEPLGEPFVLDNYQGAILDRDDPLVYIDTGFGFDVVHLWNGLTLRNLDAQREGQRLVGVERDEDGRMVIAMSDTDGFRVWTPPDPPGVTWTIDPASPRTLGYRGRLVAVGGIRGVALHSTATAREVRLLKTREPVVGVAFSPAGGHVAAVLEDGSVKVWSIDLPDLPPAVDRPPTDLDVGRLRTDVLRLEAPPQQDATLRLTLGGSTDRIRWAPRGQLMGWVGGQLTWVDPHTGATSLLDLPSAARGRPFSWSPDGAYLAVTAVDGVDVVEATQWRVVRRLPTGGGHNRIDWQGTVLVVDGERTQAQTWDPATGIALGEPFSISRYATAGYVPSPDGLLLAVRGRDPRVIESRSGALIAELGQQNDSVSALAWSPGGSVLATIGGDGTMLLWRAGTWRPFALVEGAYGRQLAFSPDGRELVSASWEGAVVVDVEQGRVVSRLTFSGLLSTVDWGPAGIVLSDREGHLSLWDRG